MPIGSIKARLAALEKQSGRTWRCGVVCYLADAVRYFAGGREVSESEWRAAGMHQRGRPVKVYIGIDPEAL
jgi:hypothetical protein